MIKTKSERGAAMKKLFRFVSIVLAMFTFAMSLSGCLIRNYDKLASNFPMTKWEADGYELYIGDNIELGGVLVCHLNDGRTVTYTADIGMFGITIADTRKPIFEVPPFTGEVLKYYQLGYFKYKIGFFRSSFTMKYCSNNDGLSPEWLWDGAPEKELKFKLTQRNLNKDDIPKVEFDPALDYCPVFYPGCEWLSDDGKVAIRTETAEDRKVSESDELYYYKQPFAGKATFSGESSEKYDVVFGQLDTKIYIGNLLSGETDSTICDRSVAGEIWECEYLENGFTAKVIKSQRYEIGTVIRFFKTN